MTCWVYWLDAYRFALFTVRIKKVVKVSASKPASQECRNLLKSLTNHRVAFIHWIIIVDPRISLIFSNSSLVNETVLTSKSFDLLKIEIYRCNFAEFLIVFMVPHI